MNAKRFMAVTNYINGYATILYTSLDAYMSYNGSYAL